MFFFIGFFTGLFTEGNEGNKGEKQMTDDRGLITDLQTLGMQKVDLKS
jgi:hypothetical protein